MATIRKREWSTGGKKRIAWQVDFRDKLNRRRAKQFSTLAAARKWADQTDLTCAATVNVTSLADAAQAWLARASSDELERSTLRQYRRVVEQNIVPYIGHIALKDLTKDQVIAFRTELAEAKTSAGARRAVHFLKMILDYAVEAEWVGRNVAHKLKSAKSARHVMADHLKIRIPTIEEQRKMLLACDRRTGGGPPRMRERNRLLFATSMETAARPSEIRGLPWSKVNLDGCSIEIAQRADSWNELGPCKTKAAYRDIPISQHLASELRAWRARCPPSADDLVFPTRTGKPISPRNLLREFARLQRAAKLVTPGEPGDPIYNLYDLRHAGASRWIHNNMGLKTLTTRLGHASAQVTLDTYGHVIKDPKRTQAVRTSVEQELYLSATSPQHDSGAAPKKSRNSPASSSRATDS